MKSAPAIAVPWLLFRPIILLLLPLFVAACAREAGSPAAVPPKIDGERIAFAADSAQRKSLVSITAVAAGPETLNLNGRLGWDETRTVRVFAPLAGRIVRLVAQPGQTVKAGDALAVIASPDFGQTQAEAARARADFALADKALARARELAGHGVIAEKELQQGEADFARALVERERTASRARLYGGASSGVDQQFVLRTPIAGVVVERNANPGQEVRPDQAQPGNPPLFVVSDPQTLWVQIELPEAALPHVRSGTTFHLRSPALDEETPAGVIAWVADGIDPTTRTTRARGSIDNTARRLKAEMYVKVEIATRVGDALHVPTNAVLLLGDTRYVFVDAGDGRYARRKVMAEEAGFGRMRVRSGLVAGEKVVTDGALLLQQLLTTGAP